MTGARKLALVHAPLSADMVHLANPVLDGAGTAPKFTDSWSAMRDHLGGFVSEQRLNRDQVLIIGDTALERDWTAAAQAAGYVEASRYFARA